MLSVRENHPRRVPFPRPTTVRSSLPIFATPADPPRIIRLKLTVRGAVQGVGFRPFVHRLATELGLTGWVNNSSQGVFIEVEGARAAAEKFLLRLDAEKPARCFVQSLESSWLDAVGYDRFEIRPSTLGGPKTTLVLPDIATCPDCLQDIFDPANRRHGYPFTNCTHCGPRFSIIESLPYDRAGTAMKQFRMCPQCQAEYDDPQDRRFHAQPNACPACGPVLELWNSTGDAIFGGHEALWGAAQALRRGKIVAVKGLGGFHLLVDARQEEAVLRLRTRKHREERPFALMFPSVAAIQTVCEVSPLEERLLRSPEAPIVLLRRLSSKNSAGDAGFIANNVAPGNPHWGVMLPSNPLHHLLLAKLGFPVVATSGNVSDEPLCTDEREALERLAGIADLFLVHNRTIVRRVDDSVVRMVLDRELVLRRARGYAPLPITLNTDAASVHSRAILAVGAHLKNTVALAVGREVFLSQHIGDLATEPANRSFQRVIADFEKLYDAQPATVAADLHPDYYSTRFADGLKNVAHVVVQHHLAHVLSCLTENEVALPALGIAWDGTGLGTDGTIWGGEFFRVTADTCERVAHLRPFPLPGGDKAVREPRRAALGLLGEMSGSTLGPAARKPHATFSPHELAVLRTMLRNKINSPLTSSAGRLFDAVASLTGLRQSTRFEGQTAMELEFAMEGVTTIEAYALPLTTTSDPLILDWAPMIAAILEDVDAGVPIGLIAARFHNALAEGMVTVAQYFGLKRVALSGGCFQNRYLTERAVHLLRTADFQPYWHQRVPPNDGGIALGQIAAVRRSQKIIVPKP